MRFDVLSPADLAGILLVVMLSTPFIAFALPVGGAVVTAGLGLAMVAASAQLVPVTKIIGGRK